MASTDQKSPVADVSSITTKEVRATQRGRTMATIEDDDERLLNQIGYNQVNTIQKTLSGSVLINQ